MALSRGRVQLREVEPYRRGSGLAFPQAQAFFSSINISSSSAPGTAIVTAEWIAHNGPVTCMAARPLSNRLTGISNGNNSGSDDNDGGVNNAFSDVVVGDDANTHLLLSAPPPTALATGGGDGKVKVWTDEGRATFPGMEGDIVASHTTANNCRRRNSAGGGGGCLSSSASVRAGIRGTGHEGAVLSVCWHPGGEVLASAGQDWAIWLWNTQGRALSYIHAHRRWTQALAFSASGEYLASCAGAGFAGWGVAVTKDKQLFTLRWRYPRKLIATQAEVGVRIGRQCKIIFVSLRGMYIRGKLYSIKHKRKVRPNALLLFSSVRYDCILHYRSPSV